MRKPHYVYIMSNDSYEHYGADRKFGFYKVGHTNNVEKRRKNLSSATGIAEEFRVLYTAMCSSMAEAKKLEKSVLQIISNNQTIVRKNREFVRAETPVPIECLIRLKAKQHNIHIIEHFLPGSQVAIDRFGDYSTIPPEVIEWLPQSERMAYFQGGIDAMNLLRSVLGHKHQLVPSLAKLSKDLKLNRDLSEDFPSLLDTIIGHFRNNHKLEEYKNNVEDLMEQIHYEEQEEWFPYRYETDFEFDWSDGIMKLKRLTGG